MTDNITEDGLQWLSHSEPVLGVLTPLVAHLGALLAAVVTCSLTLLWDKIIFLSPLFFFFLINILGSSQISCCALRPTEFLHDLLCRLKVIRK